jgi:hypothetical protein
MDPRVQIVALLSAGALLLLVLELVRRRRLLERYALLWLFSALVLVGLAAWVNLLEDISSLIGIAYPPTALFVIAFGFTLLLLLHFSVAVSRQADQSKVLAQHVALLEERLRQAERELSAGQESAAPAGSRDLPPGAVTADEANGSRAGAVRLTR